MSYFINHVHIRSKNPEQSAGWYEKYFDAKTLSSKEVIPGTLTITMDTGGPTRLNISSQPAGSSEATLPAELNTLGLEHFGFGVDDIAAKLSNLEAAGTRVVLPVTQVPGGTQIAYIEGPDDVLIELVWDPIWNQDMMTEEAKSAGEVSTQTLRYPRLLHIASLLYFLAHLPATRYIVGHTSIR